MSGPFMSGSFCKRDYCKAVRLRSFHVIHLCSTKE